MLANISTPPTHIIFTFFVDKCDYIHEYNCILNTEVEHCIHLEHKSKN